MADLLVIKLVAELTSETLVYTGNRGRMFTSLGLPVSFLFKAWKHFINVRRLTSWFNEVELKIGRTPMLSSRHHSVYINKRTRAQHIVVSKYLIVRGKLGGGDDGGIFPKFRK